MTRIASSLAVQRPPSGACCDCGSNRPADLYASGRMRRCKHCQRFYNIVVNAKKVRPHHRNPSVTCSRDEFLAWSRAQCAVRCAYCGVVEEHLGGLAIRTSIGRELAAMGIDRIDNAGDYALANIHYCCLPCNKAKGSVFTDGEMRRRLGPAIGVVWAARRGTFELPRAPRQRFESPGDAGTSGACRRCGGSRVYVRDEGRVDCSDCSRWKALIANAKKPRRRIAAPGLEVDETRFGTWSRRVDGVCAYCGIPEVLLRRLRVSTQVGYPLRFLGIDRAENAGSYRAENMVLACFPCNKVKGNVFSLRASSVPPSGGYGPRGSWQVRRRPRVHPDGDRPAREFHRGSRVERRGVPTVDGGTTGQDGVPAQRSLTARARRVFAMTRRAARAPRCERMAPRPASSYCLGVAREG